jgi:hypothetical protein
MSIRKLLFAASVAAMMMVSATAWAQSEPVPCAEGVSRVVGNFKVTLVDVTDEGDGLVTYSYDVCKILQDNGAKGKAKVTYPALSHFVWDLMHIDCLADDAQLDDLIAGACMGYVDAAGIVTDLKCDIVYELGYDPTTQASGIKINVDGIDSEGNSYKYETNGCLRFEITFDENALKDDCVLVTGEIDAGSKAGQDRVKIATVCGPVCLCVPTECLGETAWAKGNSSTCFFDYGASIPSNRWGWSNTLPYAAGTYTLGLYAGAGLCDTTKGALVGTVTVVIDTEAGTATVSYDVTAEGWTLGTTHVYVGNDPIPTGPNGNLTVAPGQLGSTITDGTPHVIAINYNGSGPIYVLAHAEVELCF